MGHTHAHTVQSEMIFTYKYSDIHGWSYTGNYYSLNEDDSWSIVRVFVCNDYNSNYFMFQVDTVDNNNDVYSKAPFTRQR